MATANRMAEHSGRAKLRPQTRQLHATVTLLLLTAISLSLGCAKPLLVCPRAVRVPDPSAPNRHPAAVLFGTDRVPKSVEDLTFSDELNLSQTRMSYGAKCEDPKMGGKAACKQPAWLKEALPAWLDKGEFLNGIRAANSDVLLFVHGFNSSFDESLAITLRIVQRTGIQAIPVAYSWPSQDKISAYGADYDRNEWSIEQLKEFIQDMVDALPERAVLHIVAHSMGNRAVLWALARLNLPEQHLGQLIMIAPDVDTEIFKDLVLRSGPFLRRTLYVSNHDLALQASTWLRSGSPRAGDARKQYVVIKEMDTVDASPLKAGMIGHLLRDYPQLMFDDVGAVLKGEPLAARKLTACRVKSIDHYNAKHGTQLPCVVHRLPSQYLRRRGMVSKTPFSVQSRQRIVSTCFQFDAGLAHCCQATTLLLTAIRRMPTFLIVGR